MGLLERNLAESHESRSPRSVYVQLVRDVSSYVEYIMKCAFYVRLHFF